MKDLKQFIKTTIREFLNENIQNIPTKKITKVFHVGDMNIRNKSQFSLEGSGLSVSKNPDGDKLRDLVIVIYIY